MNFFRNLFGKSPKKKEEITKQQPVELSLDDSFVNHFINKGGKFLYCTTTDEILVSLKSILLENNWKKIVCNDYNLKKLMVNIDVEVVEKLTNTVPLFSSCEHLIADNGNILFSSNQLSGVKLNDLSENFIVYATTSQLVRNTGEALTAIRTNFSGNIPTNISSIRKFSMKQEDDDNFLNYGNNNSKNLYLLLFEDL